MPTRVQLPDGSIGEFPDGMSDGDIEAVLQKQYGVPKTTPAAAAAPSAPAPTFGSRLLETSPLGLAKGLLTHPLNTLESIPSNVMSELGRSGEQLKEAWNTPSDQPMKAFDRTMYAIPFVGGGLKNMDEDAKQGNYKAAAGGALGTVGSIFGGELAREPIARDLSERYGGYTSPVIDPALQNASKVAKAIRPPGGIAPGLEQDLASQLPAIKAFAGDTGNPLRSQWETAVAARGAADKGLAHFNSLLDPFAGERVPIDSVPGYQGAIDGDGKALLGDVNQRISDINDLTRGSRKTAKTIGAEMTADQRLGLENEGSALRSLLYNELGSRTGIDPSDISGLRQSYGKQYGIADTIDAARRARLGQVGTEAEGGTIPLTKSGLVEKMLTGLRGGREFLADRNLRKAMQPFDSSPQEFPQRVMPDPAAIDANRIDAQNQFLHSNSLDQAAQDASLARSDRASDLRDARRASQAEYSKWMGEKARMEARAARDARNANP